MTTIGWNSSSLPAWKLHSEEPKRRVQVLARQVARALEVVAVERPVDRLDRRRLLLVEGGVGIGDVLRALGGQVHGDRQRRPPRRQRRRPRQACAGRSRSARCRAREPSAKPVMVGNRSEGPINEPRCRPPTPRSSPSDSAERLAALPGIERLREAADGDRRLSGGRRRARSPAWPRQGGHRRRRRGRGGRAGAAAGWGGAGHERFDTAAVRVDGLEVDLAATRSRDLRSSGRAPRGTARAAGRRPRPPRLHGQRDGRAAGRRSGADRSPWRPRGPATGRAASAAPALLRGRPDARPASRAVRGALRVRAGARHRGADPARRSLHRLARPGGGRAPKARRGAGGAPGRSSCSANGGCSSFEPGGPGAGGRGRRADCARSRGSRSPLARTRCSRRRSAAESPRRVSSPPPSRRAPPRPSSCARGRSGVELALARALGAEWLDRYVAEWRGVRLEIDGRDLIAEGVAEGPAVGRGLREALRAKLDGEVHGREEELRAALAAARENIA